MISLVQDNDNRENNKNDNWDNMNDKKDKDIREMCLGIWICDFHFCICICVFAFLYFWFADPEECIHPAYQGNAAVGRSQTGNIDYSYKSTDKKKTIFVLLLIDKVFSSSFHMNYQLLLKIVK